MFNPFKNISVSNLKYNQCNNFHTNSLHLAWTKATAPKSFIQNNKKIYPPQQMDEPTRPALVCHQKTNIKYSPDKLGYVACLIRGMTVDEALKQLSLVNKKGALFVKEAVWEAQEMAIKDHNVEFKSNLGVAESFSGKGMVFKGIRRHARGRWGEVRYKYSHYFVRLEEGKPPTDYYKRKPLLPSNQLQDWLEQMRRRKITNSY
uniref:Large ribosomal subunit protein uL22m n=1 Tax=Bombyx mori TaxID=7091 RepID=Q2F5Y7_BOMMO|nr:mitochondrial ribosomal protein L22 [Bombyx mori]